ncbi:MAG: hypothetical protein JWM35_2568 [Verrucomicrobia bacterium]|nr:hypothetical protein [Verrucomicrobiota bacterium]
MTASRKNIMHVTSKNPPIVELDSSAHAAYVRFSNAVVKETHMVDVDHCLVTIDTDKAGNVIGIELLGVAEFGIEGLLKKAGVEGITPEAVRNARYVAANSERVAV